MSIMVGTIYSCMFFFKKKVWDLIELWAVVFACGDILETMARRSSFLVMCCQASPIDGFRIKIQEGFISYTN